MDMFLNLSYGVKTFIELAAGFSFDIVCSQEKFAWRTLILDKIA
jgi:hypothetical protein